MLLRVSLLVLSLLLLVSCGSGGGGRSCDEALSVNYIQTKFDTEFPGFTESNTAIVHADGNQGNTYDIDKVAISRTTYDANDSLAFSYTIYGTAEPPPETYIAFFIDADRNIATGLSLGNLGIDVLIANSPGGSANGFYVWNGTNWMIQSVAGSLSSNASYFQGCTYSTTIYAPLYVGLSSLSGADASGVVMIVTLDGSAPVNITSILDMSAEFDFTVP